MVWSTCSSFSTLLDVLSNNLSNINNSETFLRMPRIKPGAAAWEAQTRPLCYSAVQKVTTLLLMNMSLEMTFICVVSELGSFCDQHDVSQQKSMKVSKPEPKSKLGGKLNLCFSVSCRFFDRNCFSRNVDQLFKSSSCDRKRSLVSSPA